jgi:ankyrin repeat protein
MRLFRKSAISRSRRPASGSASGYDSMLIEGVCSGDMPRVKSSIRHGASVNAFMGLSGNTAMYAAANDGQLRICRLLLKLGASPDNAGTFGRMPLMAAAAEGHYDVCRLLLSRKANPSKKDSDSWTALHFAAHGGHTRTCILLIQNGADVNAKNNIGNKAYDSAYNFGKLQTAQLLKSMEWLADTVGKKNAMAFLASFRACVQ